MARAKRHYIPGQVWHLTHRCHKQEFLLRFSKDRRRWIEWLFQAKKRYGLRILNYIVTSNHIHLLVVDDGGRDAIPNSVKLIAGRTGQEYNYRKNRKGAFWEDRYHATAVQKDIHLIRCLIYIDLNIVRAGAVKELSEQSFSRYNEIREPRKRYGLIDHRTLMKLLNISSHEKLKESHCKWIMESLKENAFKRENKWTKSIAVGDKQFVEKIKKQLGFRSKGRKQITNDDGVYLLREQQTRYGNAEKSDINPDNTFPWNINR